MPKKVCLCNEVTYSGTYGNKKLKKYRCLHCGRIHVDTLIPNFTKAQRLEIVKQVVVNGKPPTKVAKENGISYQTLRSWRNDYLNNENIKEIENKT